VNRHEKLSLAAISAGAITLVAVGERVGSGLRESFTGISIIRSNGIKEFLTTEIDAWHAGPQPKIDRCFTTANA
jgi:hypothetical protein